MFPKIKQWENQSLPCKLTAIGAYVGILGFMISLLLVILSRNNSSNAINNISEEEKQLISIIDELIEQTDSSLISISNNQLSYVQLLNEKMDLQKSK